MTLARHYSILHLKFYGTLCFLIGTIMFIPLFITSLIYDVVENDVFFAVVVSYGPCFIGFLLLSGWNVRFYHMIRRQEQMFGIQFTDTNAKPLWRESLSFLSDEWFIHAGSAAFYKDYIQRVAWVRQIPEGRGGYYLIVETTDNRSYQLFIRSRSGCEKVKKWWKQHDSHGETDYDL